MLGKVASQLKVLRALLKDGADKFWGGGNSLGRTYRFGRKQMQDQPLGVICDPLLRAARQATRHGCCCIKKKKKKKRSIKGNQKKGHLADLGFPRHRMPVFFPSISSWIASLFFPFPPLLSKNVAQRGQLRHRPIIIIVVVLLFSSASSYYGCFCLCFCRFL